MITKKSEIVLTSDFLKDFSQMNTSRQTSISSWLLLSIFMTVVCAIHLSAEKDTEANYFENYKGVWLTEANDEAIYLIIKKNHIANYFYKDRIDNSVYTATWELDESNSLLVSGIDFDRLSFRLEDDKNNEDSTVSILTKIPEEILGEWVRPPDYEAPKNIYLPSTYFGLWKVLDEKYLRLIKVSDNRTVVSISEEEQSTSSPEIVQGEWYKHGQQLHIAWENGTYSIIDNRNESSVKLFDFTPGEAIIEKTSDYTLIAQSQNKADENYWSENQSSITRQQNISLSQFDYKTMLKFYRGEWITHDEAHPDALEVIKFGRFGGVDLASDKQTKGNWYLSGKGCLINLDNGIRMKLKYIGSAFLVFVYEATRPLDGYPNKILKAAPSTPKKLDLLNTEPYYTLKLLEQFDQLYLKGKKSLPLISNWSDRDTINPSPNSPWWWPVWSDNRQIKDSDTFSTNNPSTSLTNDADSIASNKETSLKNSPNPMQHSNKSKWKWPF